MEINELQFHLPHHNSPNFDGFPYQKRMRKKASIERCIPFSLFYRSCICFKFKLLLISIERNLIFIRDGIYLQFGVSYNVTSFISLCDLASIDLIAHEFSTTHCRRSRRLPFLRNPFSISPFSPLSSSSSVTDNFIK